MLEVMPGADGHQPVQRGAVDVADVHVRAGFAEGARDGRADSAGARGDEDPQARRRPK
jgi:hypothetical protein